MDADELIDGDLDEIRQQPENVHTFWMQNEEAKIRQNSEKTRQLFSSHLNSMIALKDRINA